MLEKLQFLSFMMQNALGFEAELEKLTEILCKTYDFKNRKYFGQTSFLAENGFWPKIFLKKVSEHLAKNVLFGDKCFSFDRKCFLCEPDFFSSNIFFLVEGNSR